MALLGVGAEKEKVGLDVDAGSDADNAGAGVEKLKEGIAGLSPFSAGLDEANVKGFVSLEVVVSFETGRLLFAAF